MPFTTEDKILIKHYRLDKNYGRRKILHEFQDKPSSVSGLDKLIKKIDNTGGTDRTNGSGIGLNQSAHKTILMMFHYVYLAKMASLVHMIHTDKFLKLPVSPSLQSDV